MNNQRRRKVECFLEHSLRFPKIRWKKIEHREQIIYTRNFTKSNNFKNSSETLEMISNVFFYFQKMQNKQYILMICCIGRKRSKWR